MVPLPSTSTPQLLASHVGAGELKPPAAVHDVEVTPFSVYPLLQEKNVTPPVVAEPVTVPLPNESTPQLLASHVGAGELKLPAAMHDVEAAPFKV
jgi:hypothetical protein